MKARRQKGKRVFLILQECAGFPVVRRGANCFGETQRLSFGLARRPRIGLSANEGDFSLFLESSRANWREREPVCVSVSAAAAAAAAAALFFRIVFHQWKIDICTHSWCVCVYLVGSLAVRAEKRPR